MRFWRKHPLFKFHGSGGFTLAELLIALGILAIIATFTIPKIIASNQNSEFNSLTKEAMGTVTTALLLYKNQNTIGATTNIEDLTPYLNYVARDTTSLINHTPTGGSEDCSNIADRCYKLHNGAILWTSNTTTFGAFGGNSSNHCMLFAIDPDNTGPAESSEFCLYTTGKLRDRGTVDNCSDNGAGACTVWPNAARVPSWFSY